MSNYLRHAPLIGTTLILALMGGATIALYEAGLGEKAVASTSFSSSDSVHQISLAQGELPNILSGLSLGASGAAVVKKSLDNLTALSLVNKTSYPKGSASYISWSKLHSDSVYFSGILAQNGVPSRGSNFGGFYTTLEADILALK